MSFLPRRVKDLPPLEPDSEDEFKTPQKQNNKENAGVSRGNAFEQRRIPKRVSELPPLESDSEDEGKNDRLNCAILNDSFILSPAVSDNEESSPKKNQIPKKTVQSLGDDSLLLNFGNMRVSEETAEPAKPTCETPQMKDPQVRAAVECKLKTTHNPLKPIQENELVQINQPPPPVQIKPPSICVETPLKEAEAQFATPQIRSWSIARRPRDPCSTQSHKTRTAIANEFRSQKVLFQTPMAVSRAPIALMTNDSITLSLCDTINEGGTPNTAEKEPESGKCKGEVKSKKSLGEAFDGQQDDDSKKSEARPKSRDNVVNINGSEYTIQKKLGCGGSSGVFLATRQDSPKEYALKIVDLRGDAAIVEGYLNETKLLAKLQGNICVVSLFEYELLAKESKLYMVMEKGDSDLHKILQTYKTNLPLYVLMNFWYQMLQSVNYIHQNGVIHSDLKPANFLMVNGRLKLIDFGIASNIAIDSTSIIKFSQAGTFNYISPESLIDTSTGNSPMGKNQPKIKISTKSDVWSLGCILYLLIYQKTPFGHIKNIYAKVNAISSPTTEIQYAPIPSYYPVMLVQMAKKCLQHNPKQRPSVAELLQYPFNMVIPIQNLNVAGK